MKVIAHRGANKQAPQNTMPAFRRAVELGADGMENDIHLTRDGVIVVCHNYTIDETSDGSGAIEEMTFEELRQYDFGSYFAPEFAGTKLPTLEEFLDCCGGLSVINIEVKAPKNRDPALVEQAIRIVKARGLFDQLLISCFDVEMLMAARRADPATKIAMLFDPRSESCEEIMDDPTAFAKRYDLNAYHPFVGITSEEFIEECHQCGVIVNPWTVNHEEAIEQLAAWHCDGVITDVPDLALSLLR